LQFIDLFHLFLLGYDIGSWVLISFSAKTALSSSLFIHCALNPHPCVPFFQLSQIDDVVNKINKQFLFPQKRLTFLYKIAKNSPIGTQNCRRVTRAGVNRHDEERRQMAEKVTVIGGGPGGYVAAVRAAQLGAEVTLVENDNLGGTCLNWGCIPSKVMKTTADRMEISQSFREYGIVLEGSPHLDMGALTRRKALVIEMQRTGIEKLLKHHRVHHVRGTGSVPRYGKLRVTAEDGKDLLCSWERLLIATGSRPAGIPLFPFDGDKVLSSNDALFLESIPDSIVIVGGGVIGCEFAFIFSALGARVTVVEALDRILPLPAVDQDCSKVLQREMKKRKIAFFVNRTVEKVEHKDPLLSIRISPSLATEGEGKKETGPIFLEAEKVLVCVGRSPSTARLGLESLGVETDERGWIRTDARMATSVEHVYALGDVLGPEKVMLAHVASREGIIAAENAMGGAREMSYDVIPSAIFTSPEVADVGLTEAEAVARGKRVRADTVLFRNMGKAQVLGDLAGEAKIVSDADTGKVLGVHLIGPHATDLIAEGALAVQTGCTIEQLAETIHAHPTLAEIMYETSLTALDRGLHG
jgi:dihydrolipoamide dehydrogenase